MARRSVLLALALVVACAVPTEPRPAFRSEPVEPPEGPYMPFCVEWVTDTLFVPLPDGSTGYVIEYFCQRWWP